jgi:hypothetical protein
MMTRITMKSASRRQFTSAAHSEAYTKLVSRSWAAPTDGSAHKNFIGGQFVESKADTFYDVHDPVSAICKDCTYGRLPKGSSLEHRKLQTKNYAKLSRSQPKHSNHGETPPSSLVRESCSSKILSIIELMKDIKP